MAHKAGKGSTRLGRDSQGQRLGVKLYTGQPVKVGEVIVRQRGTKWEPGLLVGRGRDDTLYALSTGIIRFMRKTKIRFTGERIRKTFVSVESPK